MELEYTFCKKKREEKHKKKIHIIYMQNKKVDFVHNFEE